MRLRSRLRARGTTNRKGQKDAAKHTSKRWTSSGASAAPSRAIDEAGEKKMAVADAITSKSRAIASTCAFDRGVARLRAQRWRV